MRCLARDAHEIPRFAYRRFTANIYLYPAFGNQNIFIGLMGKVIPFLTGWVAEDSEAETFTLPVGFDSL